MKPSLASVIVGAVVVALASCKSKPDAPPADRGSAARVADAAPIADASAAADASASLNPDDFAGPTEQVIRDAFAGTPPKLPLLSRDGVRAAVDLSEPIGLSDMSTYVVGFVEGRGKTELVTLIDATAAQREDLKADDQLKASAMALVKRLADGGYSGFEQAIERQPEDSEPVALGALGTLEAVHVARRKGADAARSLQLTLRPATGAPIEEVIEAAPAGKAPGACGGEPRLGDVWFDTARRRVLVRVDFMVGGDMCENVPATYRLWTP